MTIFVRAAVVLIIAIPAAGEDSADSLAAAMTACTAISKNAERLACYDRVAAALADPAKAQQDAATAREASFGLLMNSQGSRLPAEERDADEVDSITSRVEGQSRAADGGLIVYLENGQAWRINSRDPLLKPGDSVTIRRATMGSFQMNVPSKRSVKVRRLH